MMNDMCVRPDFQIIGVQKSGSTWLWEMLRQHPEVAFPLLTTTDRFTRTKESFFFSAIEEYDQGVDFYYQRFQGLRTAETKVVGEATTDYFYDHILRHNRHVVDELPPIPELITRELPQIKIFVVLRDPVKRAISAYYHHLTARRFSPKLSLREADAQYPSLRIVARGYYGRYLQLWQQYVPAERLRVYVFEEDVVQKPEVLLQDAFAFLGVDSTFRPQGPGKSRNKRRGWVHIILGYYLGWPYDYLYRMLDKTPFAPVLTWMDVRKRPLLSQEDLTFLQEQYLPEKEMLEQALQRPLACWSYGWLHNSIILPTVKNTR